jgi:methylthioribose-1-phosphate isomerase
LTVFELQRAGVAVRLIVDSAAASVASRCDLVLAGADRVARNGDTANKVGTRMLALVARDAGKPFYVAAPFSTFDLTCGSGGDIPIEERPADEVRKMGRCRTTSSGVPVFNPAFDVTPGRMVTAFITDRGLVRPPYRISIRRLAATTTP